MLSSGYSLIPVRLMILMAHLTILIIILSARAENVEACLPLEYTSDEYKAKDTKLVAGLSVALGLIGFELLGFLSGLTMFMPGISLMSIACHATASVLLSMLLIDTWECDLYWWVFVGGSVLPAICETFGVLSSFVFGKS